MVGGRILVEYYDQNDEMQQFLPRSGTIVGQPRSDDWGGSWLLVKLDRPFNLENAQTVKDGKAETLPGQFHVTHFLVRSRWVGKDLEPGSDVSVFVLLSDRELQGDETFKSSDFPWACWGMARLA